MDNKTFANIRTKLDKTQQQMANLLGTSLKAIHSYEQGWRNIPAHVERQMLFLLFQIQAQSRKLDRCWNIKKCPPALRHRCPSWEFRSGNLCWFINGSFCEGKVQKNWKEKIKICRECEVLKALFAGI